MVVSYKNESCPNALEHLYAKQKLKITPQKLKLSHKMMSQTTFKEKDTNKNIWTFWR